jgi:hypothetical protein
MPAASQELATRLDAILALMTSGDAAGALSQINDLTVELRQEADESFADPATDDSVAETWRLAIAHLKAAEVQIEATHMAPAADSVSKAIYIATHESQISLEAPDPQLNV